MNRYHLSLFLTFVSLILTSSTLEAKINLQPDFEGTILVTYPNGEIKLIEAGDPVPDIPGNAILEVFEGKFKVTTDEGDNVQLACLEHEAKISGGSSVELSCAEDSGILDVQKGNLTLVDPLGKEVPVAEGNKVPIKIGGEAAAEPELKETAEEAAPPTEAGEVAGNPVSDEPIGVDPDVDSRSVEASPSQ